jgi:hypothetical protein
MSLYHPDEFERDARLPEDEQAVEYYRPSDICFHCAKVLGADDHLVVVHGYEGSPSIDSSWDEVKRRNNFAFYATAKCLRCYFDY